MRGGVIGRKCLVSQFGGCGGGEINGVSVLLQTFPRTRPVSSWREFIKWNKPFRETYRNRNNV